MFWTTTAVLFILATLFVLVPLWRRRKSESFESEQLRRSANIALFHERNNELEAELAAGTIDRDQFDRLVAELQHNLLADVSEVEKESIAEQQSRVGKVASAAPFGLSFLVPVVLAVLLPVVAYLLYSEWGFHEEVQPMELYQRTLNAQSAEEARDLIFALGEVVQEQEDQPWPRYFLAENLANVGLFEQAQQYYQLAADRIGDSPDRAIILGKLATAMFINAEFELTPEIERLTEEALAINPGTASVLQLLAANAVQTEDWQSAIAYWRRLIQINPNSRDADTLREQVAAAQQRLGAESAAVEGPVVELHLELAEGLQLDARLRVFVAARNAAQEGMPPLAVAELTVADLPASIRLDNRDAVGPFNLGSAEEITLSALVSRAGIANPQSGDYRVLSEPLTLSAEPTQVNLTISEQVP
ncbi:MAG: c-type cytochrome biogenesis protein CcmI [Pseudohongiellaceae bacterium]